MEDTVVEFTKNNGDPLSVSLYHMELDRTLFLLRSYLRTRLQKIEKYTFHIQKTAEPWNRLSKHEQKFAKRFCLSNWNYSVKVFVISQVFKFPCRFRCTDDMEQHFQQSVLSKLPDRYMSQLKQSVISEEDDMVPEPQLDAFVICRTKRFLGAPPVDGSGEEIPLDMYAGDICALCYKSIKSIVECGQLDLV